MSHQSIPTLDSAGVVDLKNAGDDDQARKNLAHTRHTSQARSKSSLIWQLKLKATDAVKVV
jgi:hypothetical protein